VRSSETSTRILGALACGYALGLLPSARVVARRLARDGFIDADLLKAAPKKRDSVDLLTVVAGIVKGMRQRNEEPKLAAIGKALEHMHQRTPHGGSRWSRSSVKNLLDRALEQKYLASDPGTSP
jgi:hypothetical protein